MGPSFNFVKALHLHLRSGDLFAVGVTPLYHMCPVLSSWRSAFHLDHCAELVRDGSICLGYIGRIHDDLPDGLESINDRGDTVGVISDDQHIVGADARNIFSNRTRFALLLCNPVGQNINELNCILASALMSDVFVASVNLDIVGFRSGDLFAVGVKSF